MTEYDGFRFFHGIVNLLKVLSVAVLGGVLVILMMSY